MSAAPAPPTSSGRPDAVDVRDMIVTHQGMRLDFRRTAMAVRQAPDGEDRSLSPKPSERVRRVHGTATP